MCVRWPNVTAGTDASKPLRRLDALGGRRQLAVVPELAVEALRPAANRARAAR